MYSIIHIQIIRDRGTQKINIIKILRNNKNIERIIQSNNNNNNNLL